jgi:KaiC/GvpD/RAD55 family RecA-like ATPase
MKHAQDGMVGTGFAAFDEATNGLHPSEAYLVYGAAGLGKSTFALSFISEGLVAGEAVALVTARSPASVMEQARHSGLDFEAAFRDNRLFLFEYPEDIAGNSSRLLDDLRIVEEFRAALAGTSVQRVVFDPITPLLTGPTPSFVADRFRVIANSIRAMGATALYLVDLPEGQAQATAAKDSAHGVIRFEESRDGRRLVLESMPESQSGEAIHFELQPGLGLRALPDHARTVLTIGSARPTRGAPMPLAVRTTPAAAAAATVLAIDPQESESAELQSLLGPAFRVVLAAGAADGLSAVAIQAPHLVIVAEQVRGGGGIDIARKLRGAGRNLPIVMLSRRLRRVADQAAFLHAGIDVFLTMPAERSLLRPSVWNLLRRTGAVELLDRNRGDYDTQALSSEVNCTGDLDYFVARVQHDSAFCQRFGAAPSLFVMRIGRHLLDELASVVALFTRSADLVFTGERGLVVLLAGAGDSVPFLERFRRGWNGSTPPFVDALATGGVMTESGLRSLVLDAVGVRNLETEKKRAVSSSY